MSFEPGHPKLPTAGRVAGQPNRRTWDARAVCDSEGVDPLRELIRIFKDPNTSPSDKIKALTGAMPYMYPRLSASHVMVSREDSWTEALREINAARVQGVVEVAPASGSGKGSNGSNGSNGSGSNGDRSDPG